MDAENIRNLLVQLGVLQRDIKVSNNFVHCPCPLAFFSHNEGTDKNPSFSIKISDVPYYYCFTCSPDPYRLEKLIHNYWLMSGDYPSGAAKVMINNYSNKQIFSLGHHLNEDAWGHPLDYDMQSFPAFPADELRKFKLIQWAIDTRFRKYLQFRGIPVWIQNYCKVRYYGDVLVFPLTDIFGRTQVLRARSIFKKKSWTISSKLLKIGRDLPRLTNVGAFFNFENIDSKKPIVLVEGEIDAMRLMALGLYNVIASATTSITDAQIQAISGYTTILGFDSDKGGKMGTNRLINKFKDYSVVRVLDWGLVGCKDAGELKSREQLDIVLKNVRVIL